MHCVIGEEGKEECVAFRTHSLLDESCSKDLDTQTSRPEIPLDRNASVQ